MRLLKNKYLVESAEELRESGGLLLIEDKENKEIWKMRVVKVPDEERDLRVGNVLKVSKSNLTPHDDEVFFVKKQDIINIL